jgi:MFS family permease
MIRACFGLIRRWQVVVAGATIAALGAGFFEFGYGSFVPPISDEFGWSRMVLSGSFSVGKIEATLLTAPLVGWLVDRFGPRVVAACTVLTAGFGLVMFSQISSVLWLYFAFLFMTAGFVQAALIPLTASAVSCYPDEPARASGLMLVGTSAGGVLVSPFLAHAVATWGWRQAAMGAGVVMASAGLACAILMRETASTQSGCTTAGSRPSAMSRRPPKTGNPDRRRSMNREPTRVGASSSVGSVLRSSPFWLLSTAFGMSSFVGSAVVVHIVPHLVDRGMSLSVAGIFLGIMAGMGVCGRLLVAALGDTVDKRYLAIAGAILHAGGVLVIGLAPTFALTALGLAIYGIGQGSWFPLHVSLRSELFGQRLYGSIFALSGAAAIWGAVLGPVFMGYLHDLAGNYRLAFLLLIPIGLLPMPLILSIKHTAVGHTWSSS